MLRIAFSTLAARLGGMLGAFAAVGLAVILVVSCGILLESSLRAPIPVERLASASVVVEASQSTSGGNVSVPLPERATLEDSLVKRIQAVPGVKSAIADRSFPILIVGRHGHLLKGGSDLPPMGHGWASASLTPFRLFSGHRPRVASDVVLTYDLAERGSIELGDQVDVQTPGERESFRVVGLAVAAEAQHLSREASVFFEDKVADRLSGLGDRADLIGVLLEPGADPTSAAARVGSAVGGSEVRVLTGASRGDAEAPGEALSREDTVAGLTVFALIAAFVAIFVVASTFALSVGQRHRELALFRAIGSTPGQVRRMVAGEALLVSLAAFAVAAPVSVLVARLEQGLFTRAGMLPPGLHVVVGWLPFAAGLVAAVVTTQLAAFASARRASRIRPTDAMRESTVMRRPVSWSRGFAGLGVAAGGLAVVTMAGGGREGGAPLAAMVWMLAVALLGPLLAWPFARLIGLPLALVSRGPGLLAGANTRSNLRRVASVATPLMLAVAVVSTLFYGKAILQQQTNAQTAARTSAEHVLRPQGTPGLPADMAAAVRRLRGVQQASGSFPTSVVVAADGVNLRPYPARAVDAETLARVLDIGVVSGSLAGLHADALAVSTDDAKQFGWQAGDRVSLRMGDDSPVTLRVAATFSRPLGFADILLPRALAERHVSNAFDDVVFVKSDRRVPGSVVASALHDFEQAHPAVEVATRDEYQSSLEDAARRQSFAVYVLLGLIVAFCALAVVNAMMMSTVSRGRELAVLRLIGADESQIRTMIRGETLITLVFGLTVGTLIVIPGLAVLNRDLTGSLVPSVTLSLYAGLIGFFTLVTFAAGIIPTRLALRVDPVRAMAARE